MRVVLLGAAIGLALVLGAPALAHEGEEEVPARDLTQQAVAIIRSQPDLMDEIDDKIADAIESEDAEGVDIAKVEQAQEAFEEGDMAQTELLLEQALGACPGEPVENPQSIRTSPPFTAPCPAPTHLTALEARSIGGLAEPTLLGIAAIAILGGLLLLRRTHGRSR